ncbi:MAG: hypothetical protein MZU95_14975 [Desulfomicrobium escambiense]|nr:hypothetical protein [Desulfomicrobium escambiense]
MLLELRSDWTRGRPDLAARARCWRPTPSAYLARRARASTALFDADADALAGRLRRHAQRTLLVERARQRAPAASRNGTPRGDGGWQRREVRRPAPARLGWRRCTTRAVDDDPLAEAYLLTVDRLPDARHAAARRTPAATQREALKSLPGLLRRRRACASSSASPPRRTARACPTSWSGRAGAQRRRRQPDAALRLRRLRGLACCPGYCGAVGARLARAAAASTCWPTSAAAASSARAGTRRRSRPTGSKSLRRLHRRGRGPDRAQGHARRSTWASRAAATAACWSARSCCSGPSSSAPWSARCRCWTCGATTGCWPARRWMAEYGDPDEPEDWAVIRRYSPYQNVLEAAVTLPARAVHHLARATTACTPATRARWRRACASRATTCCTARTSRAATAAPPTTSSRPTLERARLLVPVAASIPGALVHPGEHQPRAPSRDPCSLLVRPFPKTPAKTGRSPRERPAAEPLFEGLLHRRLDGLLERPPSPGS